MELNIQNMCKNHKFYNQYYNSNINYFVTDHYKILYHIYKFLNLKSYYPCIKCIEIHLYTIDKYMDIENMIYIKDTDLFGNQLYKLNYHLICNYLRIDCIDLCYLDKKDNFPDISSID